MSNLSAIEYVTSPSALTTGLFNQRYSVISANFAALNSDVTQVVGSGNTLSILTNLNTSGGAHFQFISVGSTPPSYVTTAAITVEVNSAYSDYLYLVDSSAQKSSYVIGSRAGNLADGLSIWDASAGTMIVSFSKQSVRFFQNVVGPVFDVGGALASTYNAASFTGSSTSVKIQAAINQAAIDGIQRVYLPKNLYPYNASQVSFIYTVQMVREGGEWTVFDALAYGTKGDNIQDDAPGLFGAISGASFAGGGIVYLPSGTYKISSPLTLAATDVNSIYILGQGRRDVTIKPAASCHTAILAGDTTHQTLYGRIADLTINGVDTSGHTGCGIHLIQAKYWSLERVNIESFASGTGLYLQGQAYSTGSELARTLFSQVLVATTQRPVYMQNCDENEFYSCIFGLPLNSTSSITALEINQGRNNRFYGLLLAGDSTNVATARKNYIGLYASDSVQPGGANGYNQFYGLVAEGFEKGIVIQSSLEQGYHINQYHSSVNSVDIVDNGQDTIYIAPQQAVARFGGAYPQSPLVDLSAGTQLISVKKGLVFATANTSLTTIVGFSNLSSGQMVWLRIGPNDTNTVLQDSAASLRLWGRSNLTCTPEMITPFLGIGGTAYQAGLPVVPRTQIISGSTNLFEVPLPISAASDGRALLPQYIFTSEVSLGWYRSGASVLGLSYGQLLLPQGSATTPSWSFSGASNNGVRYDGVAGSWSLIAAGSATFRVNNTQAVVVGNGNATVPTLAWASELSLGFYRSGTSRLAVSYGQLAFPDGSNTTPAIGFSSNTSLGFYSSGVQTITQSYGTFDLTAAIASLGTIRVKSGANNSCGTAVLGSNGSVNVANTYVKTGDLIFLTDQTPGGTLGDLEVGGIRDSSGFTIQSTSITDTSTVGWLIIRPG